MNKNDIISLNGIINQTTSEVNFGTQLELLASDDKGEEIDVGIYPLCRFVSNQNDAIEFEIYSGNKIIRFPIEELENAIIAAKNGLNQKIHFMTMIKTKIL